MWNPLRYRKIPAAKSATELWQVGIVRQPRGDLLASGMLAQADVLWLPDPGPFRFNADPFGIAKDGGFTVFVEALDYRVKRGEIHYYQYDQAWKFVARGVALRAPFHLSYPTILRDGDAIYMLPEAHKSGKLTLYRAMRFPDQWEPVATLLDLPAIDASVVHYENRWWMFFALPGPNGRALRELHVAYADALTGPWQLHPANPVREAHDSARPGGLPFLHEGALHLPVQDCTHSYGQALNLLRIDTLTPNDFAATLTAHLSPAGMHPQYADGLHTLSGEGNVSLIDVKRLDRSPGRGWINLQRRLRRFVHR